MVVLAVPFAGARVAVVAAGIAVDIAMAASVSDLTAVSIAFVAVLIAASALVIVLAEVVALLAAVFSFAAAAVTLVAAVETARCDAAGVFAVARRVVVLLVVVLALADVRPAAAPAAGLAAARVVVFLAALAVGDLAELVRLALAVLGRTGLLAAAVVGTDLPPSGSVTGSLIPHTVWFYTSPLLAQQSQQALWHRRYAPAPTFAASPAASAGACAARTVTSGTYIRPCVRKILTTSGRRDLNPGSPDPQSGALTKLGHVPPPPGEPRPAHPP